MGTSNGLLFEMTGHEKEVRIDKVLSEKVLIGDLGQTTILQGLNFFSHSQGDRSNLGSS